MTRDNRQILVNPHSSQEKIPVGVLNLGEIGVQHNNVEDAALYVETVADSESASTIAKFITEKAIDSKIEDAIDILQLEIDGINEAVGLPHEESGATPWGTGASVWDAIETVYSEMTAGTAAANTKVIANDNQDTHDYMTLEAQKDESTSSITYTIGLKDLHTTFDAINDAIEDIDDKVEELSAGTEDAIAELAEAIQDLAEEIETNEVVLSAITPSSVNVKEEYALLNNVGQQLGTSIKIYKDSSLYNVYLGHVDDVLTDPTDPTVVPGSGDTALCFIYEKTDGTYELVAIDVEDFLEESEFADGLEVDNHVVSVKVDLASEEVVIDDSGNTAPVLTVSADGIKVDNIGKALDVVAEKLEEEIQELAEELGEVSVSEGASVENYVALDITDDGNGATAITIDDSELKQTISLLVDDITTETAAREQAIETLMGTSASTSAETSIWGVKNYVNEVVNDLDADAVQEVEFGAVLAKDETVYGSNVGAEVVPMNAGEVGKKLVLDLSTLKVDCGEY